MGRVELRHQKKVIESYVHYGGYCNKWDAAHAKGRPDLVCAMPRFGTHFVELKHRPDLNIDKTPAILNPMTPRQVAEAKKLVNGGAIVMGGLIVAGWPAITGARLAYFNPLADVWHLDKVGWVTWASTGKFNIYEVLSNWREANG